jgi:glucose-6-phosphate isomerase
MEETINLDNLTPDIRYLNDMRDVIFDTEWLSQQTTNPELYYMYRGLKKDGNLRYDITVIPPFKLGTEFVKTVGHFHGHTSSEMYIVLEGEGLFIFQKGKEQVEDFYAVKGKQGDYIIVPQGYAHVTINPNETTLKMANWVKEESGFDYETVKNKKGLCYYFTQDGWIKNNEYQNVPEEVRFEKQNECPTDLDFLR